jgi:hypothetical protein
MCRRVPGKTDTLPGTHPDFAATAGHLGSWAGPGTITFGKDGKPLYICGPYDDPRAVIRTLERTAGRGNFGFPAVGG